jgi:hypothetical protein
MKNIIFSFLIALTGFILLQSFDTIGFGKKDGTEPGYTGSPGDTLKNCTACHGGRAVTVYDWIQSTVPSTGFIPGQKYTITATNTEIGATRFGFSISPQAIDGKLLGTMVITDTTTTKLVGNDKYITYKAAGVDGVDSRTWVFDWIAPDSVNEVVFYGAFNSNFEGHKDGDKTYLTTLKLFKNGYTGIDETSTSANMQVYPSPAINTVYIKTAQSLATTAVINIIGINGQLVSSFNHYNFTAQNEVKLDVSTLTNGIYFVNITPEGSTQTMTKKILIQH